MLITNGPLLTFDPDLPFIELGAVRIKEGKISDVGDAKVIQEESGEKVLDAKGCLILPGLIDAHTHLYSGFARGIPLKGEPPSNFIEILERLWWRLDRALEMEDVRLSALVTIVGYIRNGTTTFVDHHASPSAIDGSLSVIAETSMQSGLRSILSYEVTDRNGNEGMKSGINENVRFLQEIKKHQGKRLAGLFGLHAPLTLSDESLQRCFEAGQEVGPDVGFHVHISEHRTEVLDSLERFGKRPMERLLDAGVLGNNSIAAHCIHVTESDISILRETGSFVVHNPQSNMNNSVGCAPIRKWSGISGGLGTDAMTQDMFSSARAAYFLQKHDSGDPRVAWNEVQSLLISGNPIMASHFFKCPVGTLKPGSLGDVVISDYRPPTPISEDNFWGHLLYGGAGLQTRTVIVGGEIVMLDRNILTLDEEKIFADAQELASKVWKRW